MTSSGHCRSEACLEMFHKLIKPSGGSKLMWKLFTSWQLFLQLAALKQEIEKCFSSRHFALRSSNMLLPLLCAYRCAHLAAVSTPPQGGQRATLDLKGRTRLFCSLCSRTTVMVDSVWHHELLLITARLILSAHKPYEHSVFLCSSHYSMKYVIIFIAWCH